MGYRYRLHSKDLPGSPDLAFPSRKKVIFVHGCFWHGHSCKRGNRIPISNRDYWKEKIEKNHNRDIVVQMELEKQGWKVLVVWECGIKQNNISSLELLLTDFLDS